jgi:hypothetical protein
MPEWTRVAIKSVTVTEDDAADLAMCEQLRVVQFQNCTFEAGALARLGRHRNLRVLIIETCDGDFEELREFANSGSLASLEFSYCSIPLSVATAIGAIESLEGLGFARCALDRSCIQAFTRLPRLSDFRVIDSPVAAHDLEDLVLFPNLRFLDISRTTLRDDFIPTIQRMPRLREIDMGAFPHPPAFTAAGVERLRRLCPHLILTNYRNLWDEPAMYCGSTYSVQWADD